MLIGEALSGFRDITCQKSRYFCHFNNIIRVKLVLINSGAMIEEKNLG